MKRLFAGLVRCDTPQQTLAQGAEGCGDERDRRLPYLHMLCFASHVLLVRQPGLPDEMFFYAVIPCEDVFLL